MGCRQEQLTLADAVVGAGRASWDSLALTRSRVAGVPRKAPRCTSFGPRRQPSIIPMKCIEDLLLGDRKFPHPPLPLCHYHAHQATFPQAYCKLVASQPQGFCRMLHWRHTLLSLEQSPRQIGEKRVAHDWGADVKKYVPDADESAIKGIVWHCGSRFGAGMARTCRAPTGPNATTSATTS